MKITYLGWASFLIEAADGTSLVTDPYFGGEGLLPSIAEAHDAMARRERLDLVVVSHNSVDHTGEAFELVKKFGAVLAACGDVRATGALAGIPKAQLAALVQGSVVQQGGLRVKGVDAHHVSFRDLGDGRFLTGTPLGFMITDVAEGVTVYFAGDTSVFGDMALFARLYKPSVALLGIGGVELEGRPIVEMSPAEAAVAASLLNVKYVVPMHYLTDSDAVEEFRVALEAEAPNCTLVPLAYGQSMSFARNTLRRIG